MGQAQLPSRDVSSMTLHKGGSQDLITLKNEALCFTKDRHPQRCLGRKQTVEECAAGIPSGTHRESGQQAAESPPESRDRLFATTVYHCQGEVGELSRIL